MASQRCKTQLDPSWLPSFLPRPFLTRLGTRPIVPYPARQPVFTDETGGEIADNNCSFSAIGAELDIVEPEEQRQRDESYPLVSINEGMIARESKRIRRRTCC